MVTCPLCDAAIEIEEEELDEGDVVKCEECRADLRVTGLGPLEMESLEEEEDEDEDEDKRDPDEEEEEEAEWR